MVSSLILLRSLRVYILKQLFFLISVNSGFGNIYLAAFAAWQIFCHYSPRFQRIIVKYRDLLISILSYDEVSAFLLRVKTRN